MPWSMAQTTKTNEWIHIYEANKIRDDTDRHRNVHAMHLLTRWRPRHSHTWYRRCLAQNHGRCRCAAHHQTDCTPQRCRPSVMIPTWHRRALCAHKHKHLSSSNGYNYKSTSMQGPRSLRSQQCNNAISAVTLDTVMLSLHFNSHFPGDLGLAGGYWSKGWWKSWWQLEL